MTEFALAAFVLGLTGGLKPGPLSVYVIHVTLTRGDRAGFLASLAPFVSDGPIILLVLVLLSGGRHFDALLAGLSFAGALYLAWLALNILLSPPRLQTGDTGAPATFWTAVRLNLVNPAPYIFWATVGGAYLSRGTPVEAGVFIVIMLGTLGMAKFILARFIKTLGSRFNNRAYTLLLKCLAVGLLGFAGRLAYNGYGLIPGP